MACRVDWGTVGIKRIENALYYAAAASLKELDLSDISLPMDEVRSYLMAKGDALLKVHPQLMEEIVASVFKDQGWETSVTSYSGDGGIDVLLTDGQAYVGVQVKRYRGAIKVEQLHSLVGALVRRGMTRGIFVTTSRFQRGVYAAAEEFATKTPAYAIELVNGHGFLEALGIAQRARYEAMDDVPTTLAGHLELVDSYTADSSPFFNPFEWYRDHPLRG